MVFAIQIQIAYTSSCLTCSFLTGTFGAYLSVQVWVWSLGRDREWLVSDERDAGLTRGTKAEHSMSAQQMQECCYEGDL